MLRKKTDGAKKVKRKCLFQFSAAVLFPRVRKKGTGIIAGSRVEEIHRGHSLNRRYDAKSYFNLEMMDIFTLREVAHKLYKYIRF